MPEHKKETGLLYDVINVDSTLITSLQVNYIEHEGAKSQALLLLQPTLAFFIKEGIRPTSLFEKPTKD